MHHTAANTGLQQVEAIPITDVSDPLPVLETLVDTFVKLPHQDAVIRIRLLGSIALFAHAVHIKQIPLPALLRTDMIQRLEAFQDSMEHDKVFACEFDFRLDCTIAALQLTEHSNTLSKQTSTYAVDFLKLIAFGIGLAEALKLEPNPSCKPARSPERKLEPDSKPGPRHRRRPPKMPSTA